MPHIVGRSAQAAPSKGYRLLPPLSFNVISITKTEHMSTLKRPTEGGSGGKLGHSNMEHWEYTEEIKMQQKCGDETMIKRK